MGNQSTISRRKALKILAAAGFTGISGASLANSGKGIGAMIPGKGWVKADGGECKHDGTPLQFMPKTTPVANPLESELEKYPRCPYCGMSRKMWHHSRHLVHYDDGLADGTCSIHCLAISLSLNLDRGPKAIYAADFSSGDEPKKLVDVEKATYLIDSKLKGTMSKRSKMAFSSARAAEAARVEQGGDLANFNEALTAAYADMAKDTMMIRKRRGEKVRKMMQMQEKKEG